MAKVSGTKGKPIQLDENSEFQIDDILSEFEKNYDGRYPSFEDIPKVVHSGSLFLDLALGGGYPTRDMTIMYGENQGGKTVSITNALKACVQTGKKALVVAPENFNYIHAERSGCGKPNVDYVLVVPNGQVQAQRLISKSVQEGWFDLIVLDSITALQPQQLMAQEIGDGGQMGRQAFGNNEFLTEMQRVIGVSENPPAFISTSQVRERMDSGFDSITGKDVIKGGHKAILHAMKTVLKFYSRSKDRLVTHGDEVVGIAPKIDILRGQGPENIRTIDGQLVFRVLPHIQLDTAKETAVILTRYGQITNKEGSVMNNASAARSEFFINGESLGVKGNKEFIEKCYTDNAFSEQMYEMAWNLVDQITGRVLR